MKDYFFLSGLAAISEKLSSLKEALTDLYHQHDMRDWSHRQSVRRENHELPAITCSEALV